MSQPHFDDLADIYEATIDWPKRLANEQPFYRWLFDRFSATSVLDVACGTGRHAALFHSWGLRVEAADISEQMIRRCRQNHAESPSLRFAVRGYDRPPSRPGDFDVAICVGNSLALAPDRQTVATSIAAMLAAVRSGSAILIHVLNLWSLSDGPPLWQKCLRRQLPQGDSLIIKGVQRTAGRGFVHLLVTSLADSAPLELHSEAVPFLGLESTDLESLARQAGATTVEFYGNPRRNPYDRDHSQDLVMLAVKS